MLASPSAMKHNSLPWLLSSSSVPLDDIVDGPKPAPKCLATLWSERPRAELKPSPIMSATVPSAGNFHKAASCLTRAESSHFKAARRNGWSSLGRKNRSFYCIPVLFSYYLEGMFITKPLSSPSPFLRIFKSKIRSLGEMDSAANCFSVVLITTMIMVLYQSIIIINSLELQFYTVLIQAPKSGYHSLKEGL